MSKIIKVSIERLIRTLSGVVVLTTLLLSQYHTIEWIYITLLVGVSLFQSGLTEWCPMISVLKWLGAKSVCEMYQDEIRKKKLQNNVNKN